MNIPRSEYPRPQIVRNAWINLNGEWDFEIDHSVSGLDKGFQQRKSLDSKITVPFCPESELSGVGYKDFMDCVWYRKDIEIPAEWKGDDKRVILHFGAVDYKAIIFVNGKRVCEHKGGYISFSCDITDALCESGNYITVCAIDHLRSGNQPYGKQSALYHSHGCSYTRTTGIWQTVWMECVNKAFVKNVKYTSDIETGTILAQFFVTNEAFGGKIRFSTSFDGKATGVAETVINSAEPFVSVSLSDLHLWDIGKGNLYDAKIEIIKDGTIVDSVDSYFGMRSVALTDGAFVLNGRKVFGRWVLDQGFYPDGIYTAPSVEALKNDIIYSMQLGFNGARLHEKIFEPRFLYWADKLGYTVWGEHANWGMDTTYEGAIANFLPEWLEALERDYSHPAIIGWCPFNETWNYGPRQIRQCDDVLRMVYEVTKAYDKTRPCIDVSGNYHVVTDIFDVHDYEQDPEKFFEYYKNAKNGEIKDQVWRREPDRQKWNGEPIFMSEYGGIRKAEGTEGWGYGNAPKNDEEYLDRYKKLTDILLDNDAFIGFCYTQLYDVEQEVNGLMTYDRKFKFDPKIFYDINTRKAAIED